MAYEFLSSGDQNVLFYNTFSLNASQNSVNSITKIFVITVKGLKPVTSCVRDQDATTAQA